MKKEGHSRSFEIISVSVFKAQVFASPHERINFHELCFHAFLERALVTNIDLCEVVEVFASTHTLKEYYADIFPYG